MRNVFIATRNVTEFQRAMSLLADTEKGQPGLAVVQGKAGMGKTVCAQTWHSQHDGESFYLRVWEDWTQAAMLAQLCFEVCGERPRSAAVSKARIIDALADNRQAGGRPVLFIDEADRLQVSRIEDLRDIHDMTGTPVVMIGEEGLYPHAEEFELETPLVNKADADILAATLLAMLKTRRDFWKASVKPEDMPAGVDLGLDVLLTFPRLGLDAGKPMTVAGLAVDFARKAYGLTLWG